MPDQLIDEYLDEMLRIVRSIDRYQIDIYDADTTYRRMD